MTADGADFADEWIGADWGSCGLNYRLRACAGPITRVWRDGWANQGSPPVFCFQCFAGQEMKVHFGQVYTEPGVEFPFSHHFQQRISEEVSALVAPSAKFIQKYGRDFDIMFNVSAKESLDENEIRGPTVFKKTKDVEYTIFLPFRLIVRRADAPKVAIELLLDGVCGVFGQLGIDATPLRKSQVSIVNEICSDPNMLEQASWDDDENNTRVRKVFTKFFAKSR